MFREGLQIIKNDGGELNLNYSVSNANYGWFIPVKAFKINKIVISCEKGHLYIVLCLWKY